MNEFGVAWFYVYVAIVCRVDRLCRLGVDSARNGGAFLMFQHVVGRVYCEVCCNVVFVQ